MPQNTCKVLIKNQEQLTVSRGVHCTCDIDLHISMLNAIYKDE